ncbi:hypothetical protein H5410_055860 [Solanum commersonii]|uniref:Uncharacterized protein n=1 Tax=Solanum commersonii TaxID=4109 RepID=A0A9J5WLG9_SOLCO|nr:hypothetical protein H5410_055860 [Solanum commersonii]
MPNKKKQIDPNSDKGEGNKKARHHDLYKVKRPTKKEIVFPRTRTNKTGLSRQDFTAASIMSASSLKQLHSAEQHPIQRQDCLYQFELGSTSTANEHCNENTIMAQTSINYHMLKPVPNIIFVVQKNLNMNQWVSIAAKVLLN